MYAVQYLMSGSLSGKQGEQTNSVQSPMPCRVSSVPVKIGDNVKKGGILMVVEAMKMEHVIKAPRDVKVTKIYFTEGQLVGEKKQLVEFEQP